MRFATIYPKAADFTQTGETSICAEASTLGLKGFPKRIRVIHPDRKRITYFAFVRTERDNEGDVLAVEYRQAQDTKRPGAPRVKLVIFND